MYDIIIAPFRCPSCGYRAEENRWTTDFLGRKGYVYKLGAPFLVTGVLGLNSWLIMSTTCPRCNYRISARVDIVDGYIGREVKYLEGPQG